MHKNIQRIRHKTYIKSNANVRIYGNYVNIILMIIGMFLTISLIGNLIRINKSKEKVFEMEQKVIKLEEEKKKLVFQKQAIENDSFIEKQIRDSLGLAKADELVVVLPSDDILRSLAPVQEVSVQIEKIPNWKKWRDLFL